MTNILITGGSGQIGSKIVQRLGEFAFYGKIYLLRHSRNIEGIDPIMKNRIEVIDDINMANYDLTFHLAANVHTKNSSKPEYKEQFLYDNVELTKKILEKSGRVLFVSTDNVFKGDKDTYKEIDEPNPCNFYGTTKAMAEKIVLDYNGSVIRIQTLVGVRNNLIINRAFDAIDGKDYLPFWNDVFTRPSYFEDFFALAKKLVYGDRSQIYHVSCEGQPLSRAEISYKILDIHKKYGLQIIRDKFITENCNDPLFPKRLVLDTEQTKQETDIKITNIDIALENHVLHNPNRKK